MLQLPALPEGRVYLVVGAGVWGKALTFDKALKIARNENGAALKKYLVFDAPEDVFVTGYGSLSYKIPGWHEGLTDAEDAALRERGEAREVARHGLSPQA